MDLNDKPQIIWKEYVVMVVCTYSTICLEDGGKRRNTLGVRVTDLVHS